MRRRDAIAGLGGLAASLAGAIALRAQPAERIRRIGVLMDRADDDPEGRARLALFLQAMREAGWIAGSNLQIEYRWGAADAGRSGVYAAELAALEPEVVLVSGSPAVAALRQASRPMPIVFVSVADPVTAGFVASLARPGGSATGFALFEDGIGGKWLQLLKEIAPAVTRIVVLRDAGIAAGQGQLGVIREVARLAGVALSPLAVSHASEIENGLGAFAGEPNDKHFASAGGHLSYGPDLADPFRRAAAYT